MRTAPLEVSYMTLFFSAANELEEPIQIILLFFWSLEINSSFIDVHINIAQIYEREKKIFDADNHYQKAFSIKKDHPYLNRAYARFLINTGEIKKGLSLMYNNIGCIRFGKSNVEIN